MKPYGRALAALWLAAGASSQVIASRPATAGEPVDLTWADVATLQQRMLTHRLTSRRLVEASVLRIEALDRAGPRLNAVVRLVPDALAAADAADRYLEKWRRLIGPLHGIPVVVKDNVDVADVPTSLGTLALADALPPGDAAVVARIRQAGGIVLAKTNLAELARSSRDTVSSLLGRTLNPYSLEHTIGGSSGGTAAAVAAGFAPLGIGTDTGASIRGPAAHACLAGFRPAYGRVPLDGVAPLHAGRDTVGAMARSAGDAALLLGVMAGDDALVAAAREREPSLRGARVGVLRSLATPERSDAEVLAAFERALGVFRDGGADTVEIEALVAGRDMEQVPVDRDRFPRDLGAFLKTRRPPHDAVPVEELLAAARGGGARADSRPASRAGARAGSRPGSGGPFVPAEAAARAARLRAALEARFRDDRLTVLVYPTWSRAPRRLDDRSENGDNSGFVVPPSGYPALTVPMGFAAGTLPVGLEIVARPGGEADIVRVARAFELAAQAWRPPVLSPR